MTPEANAPQSPVPPLHVWLDGQRHVVHSLADAIELLSRSTGHPLGRYSELLVHQLEAASDAALQHRAWRAFDTWIHALHTTASYGARYAA